MQVTQSEGLEIRTGLRSVLQFAWAYEAFQRLVGKNRLRRRFVDEFVRPEPGDRVLDIGCGPGDLTPFLPEADYVGYDISSAYVRAARRRFGKEATFLDGDLTEVSLSRAGTMDCAVAVGVLHHVPDDTAVEIAEAARRSLRRGGRFIALEPHLHPGQHWIAREMIKRDRGQFVRSEAAYAGLLSGVFDNVEIVRDERMLRLPYSLSIFTCSAG